MAFDIFLTFFLVLLNGFFVSAEFAIVKVRSSQISLQSGTRAKKAAEMIIHNLDGFLAATQLGITLASLGLGWVGEDVVAELILNVMHALKLNISDAAAHHTALPVAFVVITILHIVFGELAPKSLAIRYPTPTTLTVSIPLRIFYMIFRPFIALLNGLANLILRIFGIQPVKENEVHSQEELKLIIAESAEGGQFDPTERELIQNVFNFDNRIVKQVMVPRVKMVGIKSVATLEEAITTALKEGFSRYPVYGENLDDIIGVVHTKDLVQHYMEKSDKTLTNIVRSAHFVLEHKRIDHLLREFQQMKVQVALVVSEYGGTVGLITLEDILEEIVGEIQDEYDHETPIVIKAGGSFRVVATSSIHDINKAIEESFPESDQYDTLAGLIVHHHPGAIKPGDELILEGYRIKILQMDRNLPQQVQLTRIPVAKNQEGAQNQPETP